MEKNNTYEKLIIVNWKFPGEYKEKWEICDVNNCIIVCVNINNADDFNKKIATYSSKSCIILLHNNDPNENVGIDNIKTNCDLRFLKKYEFSGGNAPIYRTRKYELGLLHPSGVTIWNDCIHEEKIKNKIFEFVWDWYWNKLNLEFQKKKIIDLFLPLAIDIQGLSEIEKEKKDSYLKEVLTEYNTDYPEKLSSEWKKVKEILAPNDGMEVLGEAFRLTEQEKNKIQSPPFFELLNGAGTENKVKEFIENNAQQYKTNSKDNTALPVWLKDVVDLIDKKIKKIK